MRFIAVVCSNIEHVINFHNSSKWSYRREIIVNRCYIKTFAIFYKIISLTHNNTFYKCLLFFYYTIKKLKNQ